MNTKGNNGGAHRPVDNGWHDAFLVALEETGGNISRAYREAKVPPRTYYNHYTNYSNFREKVDETKEIGLAQLRDRVRSKIYEIAFNDSHKQQFILLMFAAKELMPEFRDNANVQVIQSTTMALMQKDKKELTDEELHALAEQLRQTQKRLKA